MKRVYRIHRPEWSSERAKRADIGSIERMIDAMVDVTKSVRKYVEATK